MVSAPSPQRSVDDQPDRAEHRGLLHAPDDELELAAAVPQVFDAGESLTLVLGDRLARVGPRHPRSQVVEALADRTCQLGGVRLRDAFEHEPVAEVDGLRHAHGCELRSCGYPRPGCFPRGSGGCDGGRRVRALVCPELGGEEVLRVDELPSPECGPRAVRIGARAASVNFPDTLVIRGQYQYRYDPPFVPGHECAGTVLEVGDEVDGFASGDRVLAMTGTAAFAEEVVADTAGGIDQVYRIPDAMPFDEAAGFDLTYGTAIHAWRRGQLQPGESVLVLGAAGGCGSAALQVAKAMGAFVIAAAGGAEKLAIAEQCGADAVVDYRTEPVSERVKELTGGNGVDLVFDPVGGSDFREYLRGLAWNGRYLVVGFASGEIPQIGLNLVLLKSIAVVGVAYRRVRAPRPGGERRRVRTALPLVRRRVAAARHRSSVPVGAGWRRAPRREQPRCARKGHHRDRLRRSRINL